MNPTEFRRAADRGMGRTAICLIENDPAPYLSDLVETCLQGLDQDNRVDYLFALITFARAEAWVEGELLAKLPTIKYPAQIEQVWGVLNRFARLGLPRSREAVMAHSLRKESGAKLVAAWGIEGLEWLKETRPEIFVGDDPEFVRELVDAAEEVSGEETVGSLLGADLGDAGDSEPCLLNWPDVSDMSWEDFLARVPSFDPRLQVNWASEFAKAASPEDWVRAAEWALTDEAATMNWLVAVFYRERPWPLDPAHLFPRLDEGYLWRSVLSGVSDPRIREIAFERLEREEPDWDFAALLRSSVKGSDADRLMRIAKGAPRRSAYDGHALFVAFGEIAGQGISELIPVFEWTMDNVICSTCRRDIAQGLAKHGQLSERYRGEVGFDVETELHEYADDRQTPILSAQRFRRAAAKGLGRAILSAMQGPASLYGAEVQWVALFGSPMLTSEIAPRAAYVWRLVERVGGEEKVLEALLRALDGDTEDPYARGWHRALVAEFAKRGDARAQAALSALGEVSENEPRKFKGVVVTTDEALARRFALESALGLREREARAFGRMASESERRFWAERMLREEDEDTLHAMGQGFIRRPWPLDPELVIARVQEEDQDHTVWREVLKAMPHPEVRVFALEKLAEEWPNPDAIGYLRTSYMPGDEEAVYGAVARIGAGDDFTAHHAAWELVKLAWTQGAEPFVPHLEWVVEHSPSSEYRRSAIGQLLAIEALSDYHRQEARHDAEPETRALVDQ
jgi:hypothetical protein